jgi:hypothetical protein
VCDYLKVDGTPCRRKGYCWQHRVRTSRGYRADIKTIALGVLVNLLTLSIINAPDWIAGMFSDSPETRVAFSSPAELPNTLVITLTGTGTMPSAPPRENPLTQASAGPLIDQNAAASTSPVVASSTEALGPRGVGPATASYQLAALSNLSANSATVTGVSLSLPLKENLSTQDNVETLIARGESASRGLSIPSNAMAFPAPAVASYQPATFSSTLGNPATAVEASFSLPQQQNPLTQGGVEVLTNPGVSASTGRIVLSDGLAIPKLEISCPVASSGIGR